MREFMVGFGYLGKGQRWVAQHGRWFGFGLIPALIALLLYVGALVVLGFWADDLAAWATPFADDWSSPWPGVLRGVFVVMFLAAALFLAVLTFTAVTLLIGDPFYESLSEKVEESEGHCPTGPEMSLLRGLWVSACESLYVLGRALVFTIPLFFLGFVPFIGQSVIPALGFAVAGFFLTVELTSVALQRRGTGVRDRVALLKAHRRRAIGFGLPLALAFLVPFVAVLLMPGAVAGATLLVRDLVAPELAATGQAGGVGEPPEVRHG